MFESYPGDHLVVVGVSYESPTGIDARPLNEIAYVIIYYVSCYNCGKCFPGNNLFNLIFKNFEILFSLVICCYSRKGVVLCKQAVQTVPYKTI